MKKGKIITIALAIITTTFIIAGCGNGDGGGGDSGPRAIPNEARIMNELSNDGRSIIPREHTITNVEILDYETNRDIWSHRATVSISSNDREVEFVKFATMTYNRNDDREWVLVNISPDRENQWTTSPLVGVNMNMVENETRNVILRQTITIDGDDWFVDDNTLENISINNQNTQLQNHRDVVIVDVVLSSDAMTAQGQIELDFTFNNGWFLNNHIGHSPFVSEYRPAAVFELTNEQLLNEIVQGNYVALFNNLPIELASDAISNFSIANYVSSNRGANRVYDFSFNVEKGVITYAVSAQAFYNFDSLSGWGSEYFTFAPEVSTVELAGTRWIGTYTPPVPIIGGGRDYVTQTHLTIEINEMTPDGSIRATLIGSPPEIRQASTGTFDFATLTLTIVIDEWLTPPTRPSSLRDNPGGNRSWENILSWSEININGRLNADGVSISHTSGIRFEVNLTDELPAPLPETEDNDYNDDDDDDND